MGFTEVVGRKGIALVIHGVSNTRTKGNRGTCGVAIFPILRDKSRFFTFAATNRDSRDKSRFFKFSATNCAFYFKSGDQIRVFSFKSADQISRSL